MTFATGWALGALVLLAPLVILHLRQRAGRERQVASLLLWHEFELDGLSHSRRLRPPPLPLPLLLALQAIALILLVLTLADPALKGGEVRPTTVVVLDDSFEMTAPGVMTDAKREVNQIMRSVPAGSAVRVVLVDGAPSVLYRGTASGAVAAVGRVRASAAPADLPGGMAIAAGLLTGPRDRVVLIRASQDSPPALSASPGELRTLVAGSSTADRGIFDPIARCGVGTSATCEVVATVTNASASPAEVRIVADVSGHQSMSLSARVGADASTHVQFLTDPGEQVRLALVGSDAVSIDNQAWVTVPGDDDVQRSAAVTVVGTPAEAGTLAQAFAAVPGVRLRLETSAGYRAGVARTSDLVILDGALPHGDLPPAPAVMLIDPTQLPGGHVGGAQADSTLSGVDPTSALLQGADLSSLTINRGAARRLSLPRSLVRVLWSPSGPLLAAGDDGRGRLIVTAFQPDNSTLAQLDAFPLVAANIVRWALGWAPGSAVAGTAVGIDALPGAQVAKLLRNGTSVDRVKLGVASSALDAPAPGVYTLSETGPGVSHQATIDVNLAAPAARGSVPVDIRAKQLRSGRGPRTPLAPWLLLAGLVVLALEWAYWSTRRVQVLI